ncbi:MAG: MBL fold metallo-hydrolase [Flavobacteriales bacterium]
MKIEQIYTGCLAHGAYYIESNGEVAVVDPLREVQPYMDMANSRNARIKYVFETHFHADFVSGHIDLAARTGASIVYGPTTMKTGFEMVVAQDGQEFPLGKARIRVIHTPGHTMESSCYLLINEEGKEEAIFTGDTLFIGDVGRPDLAQKVIAELTQEKLANHLYDSLRDKIMPLSDDLIVYPGHGAGSACGKKMSSETTDTLGHQKKTNYALNPNLSREEFVREVLSGLTPPPGYFPQNVLLNIQGYESFEEVKSRASQALSPAAFEAAANEIRPVIIDTRPTSEFIRAFIPGSINIGLDGSFASWVGTLVPDTKQEILLVCEPGREEEAITRMARVGYDRCMGYLGGGFDSWKAAGMETDQLRSVSANDAACSIASGKGVMIDVRRASEYNAEHVDGVVNAPLDYINDSMTKVDRNNDVYVHCAGGYRSVIFISILQARGFRNLINVEGGFKAIKESGLFRVTEYVEQSTEL